MATRKPTEAETDAEAFAPSPPPAESNPETDFSIKVETPADAAYALNNGFDPNTGAPLVMDPQVDLPKTAEEELSGVELTKPDESAAALRTTLTPGAPIVPNANPLPNQVEAVDPAAVEVTRMDNAQPVMAIQAQDYKREMSNREAIRAKALKLDDRGGCYGIRNAHGEIVAWVDGNGIAVEEPEGFVDSGEEI